jgi:RNA polymerase subunit RPABC4/transcription elongation factor Spt4
MPNYFYFDQINQKQGPVSEQQLKALAAQGVIGPNTPMETDGGHKGIAGQIPGLFAAAPPSTANLFCTNCGAAVAEQAVACMSCGASPMGHQRFCRNCGAALNPGQVVCTRCGSATNAAAGMYQSAGTISPVGVSDNSATLIVCSILMTVCCCFPAGIPGIIFSIYSKNDFAAGRYESAAKNSKIATWCLIGGLITACLLVALYFVLCFIGGFMAGLAEAM